VRHDIGVWLGVVGPRAARPVRAKADGWSGLRALRAAGAASRAEPDHHRSQSPLIAARWRQPGQRWCVCRRGSSC